MSRSLFEKTCFTKYIKNTKFLSFMKIKMKTKRENLVFFYTPLILYESNESVEEVVLIDVLYEF